MKRVISSIFICFLVVAQVSQYPPSGGGGGTTYTFNSPLGESGGSVSCATCATTGGNVATATALASNPTDCGANTYATTIAANGNLTCASITNAATTAASTNTASTIVLRDGSGNFAAGTITAALSGNASTATALASPISSSGTFASRPSAGTSGRTYHQTDGPFTFLDNGASWDVFLSPIGKVTLPPAVSALTWGNQGTSTTVETYGGFVLVPQIAGSWNPRSLYKSKGANKRLTVGFYPGSNTNGFRMGMFLWDSSTTDGLLFEFELINSAPRFNSTRITDITGGGAAANWGEVTAIPGYRDLVLLQYYDDGVTNRNFYCSGNGGRTWHLLNSQSRTANTVTPDNWGVFYNGDTGSTTGDMHVVHWLEEAN